jgi:hypothetical protein
MFWLFAGIFVDPRAIPVVNGPRTIDNGHGVSANNSSQKSEKTLIPPRGVRGREGAGVTV